MSTTELTHKQNARRERKEDPERVAEAMVFQKSRPRRRLAAARSFKLQKSDQQQSRLSQLPDEIKDMIFVFLLKHDEPLRKAIHFPNQLPHPMLPGPPPIFPIVWPTPVPMLQNFQFDPQVLSVCQKWYHDFADILHHRNRIAVDLTTDLYEPTWPLLFVMGNKYLLQDLDRYTLTDTFQNQLPDSVKAHKNFHVRLFTRATGSLPNGVVHPLPADLYTHMPLYSRALLLLLFKKNVTFEIPDVGRASTTESEAHLREHLVSLRLLRCQSFNIMYSSQTLTIKSFLKSLEREIQSSDPPVDPLLLCDAAEDFLKQFRKRFLPLAHTAHGKWFRGQVEEMRRRADGWEVEGFMEVRKALMDFVGQKMKEFDLLRKGVEECMPEFLDS